LERKQGKEASNQIIVKSFILEKNLKEYYEKRRINEFLSKIKGLIRRYINKQDI
jgi:hypothetical protein